MNLAALPVALALSLSLVASRARAADPTKQECVAANDAAQDLRQVGKLRQAREKLAACAAAGCPGVVRDDCTQRLAEVDSAMPHIVFAAKDGKGNDLVDVKVTMDGAPIADKLDGASLKIDPGLHVFAFAWRGHPVLTKSLVLAEHDQARQEQIVFGSTDAARGEPAEAVSSGTDRKTIAFAVGGAGGVALVVGSVFGLVSKATYDRASATCRDGGACMTQDVQYSHDAHSQAAVATASFVVGGALIGAAGALLYLTAPAAGVTVGTTVGSHEAGLGVRGLW